MTRPCLLLLLLLLPPWLTACGDGAGGGGGAERPAPTPGDRSILLVTVDTTRADMVGAYGAPVKVTPTIDGLAERGVLFENAYAPMPQTLPSHATVLTGLMPRMHGALENMYVLDERFPTLATVARGRGYDTGAFIGALAIEAATGVDQGFDVFDQPAGDWGAERKGHPPQRKASDVTDAALAWADGLGDDRPFLLWAHYYDPHGDANKAFMPPQRHYDAINPTEVEGLVASRRHRFGPSADLAGLADFWRGYLAELRFTDEQVGRLIDGLRARGLMDDTVVVVVGDHGEGLFEHGEKGHGTHLWEEMLRVPFVVASPDGRGAGTRVSQRVILQDIEPTVRHMAFGQVQAVRDPLLGVDLWQAVVDGEAPPERPVFLERPHYAEDRISWRGGGRLQYGFLIAVLDGDLKLVREPDGTTALYDLSTDPDELVDLSDQRPEDAARLEGLIAAWQRDNRTSPPGSGSQVSEDDPRWQTLQALGYIGDDR